MRSLLFAAALVASAQPALSRSDSPLPPISPERAGFSARGLQRIDDFFDREIKANRVPGAVVGIARDGKLVYLKAFGYRDKEAGKPMQVDSIFGLASMTKIMTAVGALSLTEQGRLPLYSLVSDYFPAFGQMKVGVKGADGNLQYEPQKKPIRIQDLMRHTSGITYGGRPDSGSAVAAMWPPGSALQGMTTGQFIDTITKLPLSYQPGTVFEYSESFDVLAAIVEKVTGNRFDEQIEAAKKAADGAIGNQ